MKQSFVRKWLAAGVLVAFQGVSVLAQNGPTTSPPPSESATPQLAGNAVVNPLTAKAAQNEPSEVIATGPAQAPLGVDEILRLLKAGVGKDVIKAYIETAPVAAHLSASDLVTLKERGVPDDLTLALVKRGAELAGRGNQVGVSTAPPTKVSGSLSLSELLAVLRNGQINPGALNPEGYDYFRYYYLYPRTLASVNERLYSSYPWFAGCGPYGSGFGSPWAFRPRFFAPEFPGP
jgi:hypothetical protein